MDVRTETARLRGWFEFTASPDDAGKTIVRLWEEEAWQELGHSSWRDYCAAEFPVKPKWPADVRRTLVRTLSDAGMSQRDVAAVLGVSVGTVNGDLAFKTEQPTTTSDRIAWLNQQADMLASKADAYRREAALIASTPCPTCGRCKCPKCGKRKAA